jgi:uncharacterized protein (TIGR03437 family)
MTAQQTMRIAYSLVLGALPLTLYGYRSRGPEPRYTAAPGDARFACATAGCHTDGRQGGPINSAGGSVVASFSEGSTYIPGTPLTITVRVADPTHQRAGFQMTARSASNLESAAAGRFAFQGSAVEVVCDNGAPRTPTGNCATSAPVEFIQHSTPSSSPWTFTWTPPANQTGPVHFYVAGNAVNGNSSPDGDDHVYTASYVLTPASACTTATPQITGIISAGAFGARTDFAPGSWLEVYGSNFSTASKEWAGADFNGTTAPAMLDRVRVRVNGQDAFTRFISPGQVNVQAPANANGPLNVTVTNCNATSAPSTLTQVTAAPGMYASAGKLVAFAPDGTTRAARPGEMIVAYGIGFGPTNPSIAPGAIVAALNSLAEPLTVTIGGVTLTPQQIVYAGLSPNFVGLYQFNLIVPNVPDGDQPLTMRVGNASLTQALTVSVRR